MVKSGKIEYHHMFPRKLISTRYPRTFNQIANPAYISGATNRALSATEPAAYLRTVVTERLAQQQVSLNPQLWQVGEFEALLGERRLALAQVLNEMLGLDSTTTWSEHDGQLADDLDDEAEEDASAGADAVRRLGRPRVHGRVPRHISEVMGRYPGQIRTVAEVAAEASEEHRPGKVSRAL